MNKYAKELKRRLTELGIEVVAVTMTGKGHQRLALQKGGHTAHYAVALTPSDGRAWRNALADIKRLFNERELALCTKKAENMCKEVDNTLRLAVKEK